MRSYSTHKTFVKKVERLVVKEPENFQKMLDFSIQYFSIRSISGTISDEQALYVIQRCYPSCLDMDSLYRHLTWMLTNQQYIFRIKRIKYLHDSKDGVSIVPSPLISDVGQYLQLLMFAVPKTKNEIKNESETNVVLRDGRYYCPCGNGYKRKDHCVYHHLHSHLHNKNVDDV